MYRFSFFYFVFEDNFPTTSPRGGGGGLYLDGQFTEGFLRYRFGGLVFGGAYTWRGLFSEFYGIYALTHPFFKLKYSSKKEVNYSNARSLHDGEVKSRVYSSPLKCSWCIFPQINPLLEWVCSLLTLSDDKESPPPPTPFLFESWVLVFISYE